MEWYRSGHNELHWNCSSRETGPWVRIPLTPPNETNTNFVYFIGGFAFKIAL